MKDKSSIISSTPVSHVATKLLAQVLVALALLAPMTAIPSGFTIYTDPAEFAAATARQSAP